MPRTPRLETEAQRKERLKRLAAKRKEWRKTHPLTEDQKARKAAHLLIWRKQNPEKIREYSRRWRARHRYAVSVLNRKNHHGILSHEYEQMLCEHAGRCSICEKPMHDPHVDHCHDTGRIRGLLCALCNKGIGQFKDSADICERAAAYLRKHTLVTLREVA